MHPPGILRFGYEDCIIHQICWNEIWDVPHVFFSPCLFFSTIVWNLPYFSIPTNIKQLNIATNSCLTPICTWNHLWHTDCMFCMIYEKLFHGRMLGVFSCTFMYFGVVWKYQNYYTECTFMKNNYTNMLEILTWQSRWVLFCSIEI